MSEKRKIDLTALSDDAKVIASCWFSRMRVGSAHSGLTFEMRESRPTPRTEAALAELVEKEVIATSATGSGGRYYAPTCAWPEDCTVQWGHGIVPAVPFLEAFPPGTFIRGEGDTIAAAEQRAFAQYQRDIACDHVWGRYRPGMGTYTNGGAFCRKCGGFRGSMFPEIKAFGWWRKPLSRMEHDHLLSMENDADLNARMDRKYPELRDSRRRNARILRLRFNLFGATPRQRDQP